MGQKIKFETAKLAKEKGFDSPVWDCFNSKGKPIDYSRNIYAYENDGKFISRPEQSELMKWLREVHNFHPYVVPHGGLANGKKETWKLANVRDLTRKTEDIWHEMSDIRTRYDNEEFDSYEEALEMGLYEILTFILKKEEE